ncbi:undecaprenyl-phosphate glucose phosphotransferase [Babesia caballi]|uniref:Undecaprenyl-phosphate glucose phosphotransferase n=1 Tax=Babesia caballi TaxID=5871 RepID=A0AAV4LTN4_BABCB|nr:undecaprenyl-phosphate glucose phosphotransferase [Babesia caballi]
MHIVASAPQSAASQTIRRFYSFYSARNALFACRRARDQCFSGGCILRVPSAITAHRQYLRPFSTSTSIERDGVEGHSDPGSDEGVSALRRHGPGDTQGHLSAFTDFVQGCSGLAETIVFDRRKQSKQVRDCLLSLGSTHLLEALRAMDCAGVLATNARTTREANVEQFIYGCTSLAQVCYVSTTSGISVPRELLLGYVRALQSSLMSLLQIDPLSQEASESLNIASITLEHTKTEHKLLQEAMSHSLALFLLSAAESGLGAEVRPLADELLSTDAFITSATGSCINSAAFIRAMDGAAAVFNSDPGASAPEKLSPLLGKAVASLSYKETSLCLRDLFYCKLWVTCVEARCPGFTEGLTAMGRSFVNNVVMMDHVVESVAGASDAEAAIYAQLRKEQREVDLDFLLLDPFVFPLLSCSTRELYEADADDCYFDSERRAERREWLAWRRLIADLNGWKVVEVRP